MPVKLTSEEKLVVSAEGKFVVSTGSLAKQAPEARDKEQTTADNHRRAMMDRGGFAEVNGMK